jgi:hypothetical protein
MESSSSVFAHTDANLLSVLEELKRREPIFHTGEFGTTRAEFEKLVAPEYWEVSASKPVPGSMYPGTLLSHPFRKSAKWMGHGCDE